MVQRIRELHMASINLKWFISHSNITVREGIKKGKDTYFSDRLLKFSMKTILEE